MISLSGQNISLSDLQPFFDGPTKLNVSREVKASINKSRKVLEKQIESGEIIYGINTGFGALSQYKIDDIDLERLQLNLVRSHCAGIGSKFNEGITCPYCHNKLTEFQKERFAMRQKQIVAAKKLNKSHIFQKEY